MKRPERLCQNIAQVALIGSNKFGISLIKINSHDYITSGAVKRFFAL